MTTTNAAAAEKARMTAIMDLPEGATNPRLAGHLAVATDMTPEAAKGVLSAAKGEGQFAHLNTPEAKASLAAWQEGRGAREEQSGIEATTERVVRAAEQAGVARRSKW